LGSYLGQELVSSSESSSDNNCSNFSQMNPIRMEALTLPRSIGASQQRYENHFFNPDYCATVGRIRPLYDTPMMDDSTPRDCISTIRQHFLPKYLGEEDMCHTLINALDVECHEPGDRHALFLCGSHSFCSVFRSSQKLIALIAEAEDLDVNEG
ncbi:hypothetical protein NECAME_15760, partial [Necator americanus]